MKFLVLLVPLFGCGTMLYSRAASENPDCRYYDDSHLAWQAVGAAMSGVAAATGGAGGLVSSLSDVDDDVTIGLSVTSAVAGALGTVAALLSGEYAARYSERCSNLSP